jgi:tRNA pseudouridine13 synthase
MYRLKQIPEDFVVDEIFHPKLSDGDEGNYLYALVRKKNVATPDAIGMISKALHLKQKDIGFAGNKDKRAVTSQLMSFYNVDEKQVSEINIQGVDISVLGRGEKPISLGDHEANRFIITIRELEDDKYPKIEAIKEKNIEFINYFGEQRFGTNNIKIGIAIVRKDFKKACELIDDPDINSYLEERPNDCVGALRTMSKRRLTMYVHAVQSHVWNVLADKFRDEEIIPIPGYMTEFENSDMRDFVEKYYAEFGFISRDFIIREIPNLFTGGGSRKRVVIAKDVKIEEKGEDDLNPGKKKITLSFSLPTGSYATVFIKSLFV